MSKIKTACNHLNFNASVDVNRLTKNDGDKVPIGYAADLRITCADCGISMEFVGVSVGVSNSHPTCSIDTTELRIPIRPENMKHVTQGTKLSHIN